jgi:outer membrane protein, heavy metal efflux system
LPDGRCRCNGRWTLDLRRRALESFQAGFATAEELGRAGNIPEVDVANQRAQVEAARVAVAEAENAWLDAKEQLIELLGVTAEPQAARLEFAGPLELPEAELPARVRDESVVIEASLELAELKKRMDSASRSVGLAKTEGRLPHLSGGFHAERDVAIWEIGGHLTIGIPIFDRAQGRQHSANAEFSSLRERYLAEANSVRATHRVALTRVESTARRARHYRDQVIPAREKALGASVRQYNAMQASVFQLLQVQREVTDAASAYVDTLVEHWKARAALETLASGRKRGLALGAAGVTRAGSTGGMAEGADH